MNGAKTPITLAFLRIVTGVIFVTHGVPKLAGGIESTAGFLGSVGVPLPTIAAWAVALLETFGGLALVLGAFTAPVAILLAIHMALGIVLVHYPHWYVLGPGAGEVPGSEFNVLLIAALLTTATAGPGALAIGGRSTGESI